MVTLTETNNVTVAAPMTERSSTADLVQDSDGSVVNTPELAIENSKRVKTDAPETEIVPVASTATEDQVANNNSETPKDDSQIEIQQGAIIEPPKVKAEEQVVNASQPMEEEKTESTEQAQRSEEDIQDSKQEEAEPQAQSEDKSSSAQETQA